MALLNRMRKKLGKLKCFLFDQLPYRAAASRIPGNRREFLKKLNELEKLVSSGEPVLYEIHMLCGKRDMDMGKWASWSIMRFMDGRAHLYIHSDGTLEEEDITDWIQLVGGASLVNRETSNSIVGAALEGKTSLLQDWRNSNWASAQLVDVHFFGQAPMLLVMDSDVLTFSRPDEVMNSLISDNPHMKWCQDLVSGYSLDPSILSGKIERSIPSALCAGFLVTARLQVEDFIELDKEIVLLSNTTGMAVDHFWSCQTYYAILASRYDGSSPFSSEYSNTWNKTKASQVLRHYVGVPRVRFRYFEEGLPRVTKEIGSVK